MVNRIREAKLSFFRDSLGIGRIRIRSLVSDGKRREFYDGEGLFNRGIKEDYKLGTPKQQFEVIENLPEVTQLDVPSKTARVDLGWAGNYEIRIQCSPVVMRLDKESWKNPFISDSGNTLCLGNADTLYSNCWHRKDYLQCIKIIIEILRCKKDRHGHRRWSGC